MRNRQAEAVKQLTDRELLLNVYLTQGILLLLAALVGSLLFRDIVFFLELIEFSWIEIIVLGGGTAFLVIGIDLLLMHLLSEEMLDDGGINERIFSRLSVSHIFILSAIISFSEELLFRGVIQTYFGLIFSSLLFAFIHVRYLSKPVLFISVVGISFLIGILYEVTGNLLSTITAHFLIDFIMGCFIKKKARMSLHHER
ncbi:CPBP family intramembrane glutamic endopeptidase [Guptibacillus spartinae]|uniref:CPBP family intramembrane glutamic endopeptidase n=1 Tax=Guptibacillus spartinae TaxID=3025679 RepID=UPI0023617637|nr:CPBP family intramembrane glutamic endopeptidase [Pseudalkalibacillus spartinae]